jgi:type II secretion system protein I
MGKGRGFVLLEALIAVAIFALGVLSLGRCISQALNVERLKNEDARARRVLQNRFAEIEAGSVSPKDATEDLKGEYAGLTLSQKQQELHKYDELGKEMGNLFEVTLTVVWTSDGSKQTRMLMFYVSPKKS